MATRRPPSPRQGDPANTGTLGGEGAERPPGPGAVGDNGDKGQPFWEKGRPSPPQMLITAGREGQEAEKKFKKQAK